MEGETPEFVQPKQEVEKSPFLRVEFDGEHKLFVKVCTECGNEFRTGVPRKFFKNPNDESTTLRKNGSGTIDGFESIRADAVKSHIFDTTCADAARHEQKSKSV